MFAKLLFYPKLSLNCDIGEEMSAKRYSSDGYRDELHKIEELLGIPYVIGTSLETILANAESLDDESDDYEPMPDALIEPDFAEEVDAKLDAQALLKTLPKRLILIAQKRINESKITRAEQKYLERWRSKLKRS
jgi:hypothetical protein